MILSGIPLWGCPNTNGERLVSLTLDDGPAKYIDRLLPILAEHDATATFFIQTPDLIEDPQEIYDERLRQIHRAGHQLASHT